jgi:hypothetical protein
LAEAEDRVCIDILSMMGIEMGRMVGGLINKVNMQNMCVPIILGGSLYTNDNNEPIIKSFKNELRKYVAENEVAVLRYPLVLGAVYSGLAEIGISLNKGLRKDIVDNLLRCIKGGICL